MEDYKKFPPVVDLLRGTKLQWQNPNVPVKVPGGPTSEKWAAKEPTLSADLNPYNSEKE